uniref:Ethanolaminephosphotransferase n=1 Tax=Chlamydomonas asymmetrica TaxID=51683 RepID=A0A125SQH5_9CHLO|nr:ethanolaminephosphotransferase [Chlamydomonas asymmetrica]
MAVLSQRALAGLKAYKYKPGGYTILDVIHTPLWNWMTEQLPMWLAPNLITLSGLLIMFVCYLINWYYLPEFAGEAPRWVYTVSGLSVIIYTNLDCIDGKQARRTKTSSPLGQLFDHGCDAISLHIMLSLAQCAFGHQSDWQSAIILEAQCVLTPVSGACVAQVKLPWLVSHYEEYHTGVLMYGDGFFGILEANYTLAIIMLITGYAGPSFWHQPLLPLLPERGHKELGFGPRVRHLLYCLAVIAAGYIYIGHPGLKPAQSRLEALTEGVIYAYIATQLIMDHMCKEPFEPPRLVLGALLLVAANSVLGIVPPHLVAYAFTPVMVVLYVRFVVGVVNEVCAYLGIPCLTIKHHAQ